jgi:glyoxylase-like metal-dependent hydrolase (beta-lactamase superfamily II)
MTLDPPIRSLLAPNPSPLTGSGTNTWIVGATALAVIDPGPEDSAHLSAILAAIGPGQHISHIFVTHAHRDHSALAARLSAASGAPVLAFGTATEGRSPLMASLAPGLPATGEGLDLRFTPDQRLADDDTISGPDWSLSALHTPGHLGGHICLALGDTLFSGDHVMGWATSIVSPPDGDMGAYMASLHRLAAARTGAASFPATAIPVDSPRRPGAGADRPPPWPRGADPAARSPMALPRIPALAGPHLHRHPPASPPRRRAQRLRPSH